MNGRLRALSEQMISAGLPEIAVSHPTDWGIEVPIDRFRNHRIYVWFEMAAGYLAAGGNEHTAEVWATRKHIIQFLGVDNGYFHSLLFPAIMRAFDEDLPLPTAFITNEFYRLDGLKFSTSRQHAIWLSNALDRVPADHLRLYLSWDRPTVSETNFRWETFYTRMHGELLPRWHDWLTAFARRSAIAISATKNSKENAAGSPAITTSYLESVRNILKCVHEAYGVERFSPRTALEQLDLLVQLASENGRDSEHLAAHPSLHYTFVREVRDEFAAAIALAMGLYPIAPVMAGQLWGLLRCPGRLEDAHWGCPEAHVPNNLTTIDVDSISSLFIPISPHASLDDEK